MEELRTAAQSLKSDYQATTNDIETELNKAKEITDSYDSAVKEAKIILSSHLKSLIQTLSMLLKWRLLLRMKSQKIQSP